MCWRAHGCARLSSSVLAPSLAWCRGAGPSDPSLPEIRRVARKLGVHGRTAPGAEGNEWTGEPESRPRLRPPGVALRTQKSRTAGQRRQPGAKVSWDKFRGGGCSGPVLRQKTERAPVLPGVRLLGLRLPAPSRSRLSLIPVALVLPVACSQISVLFLHGDPPQGKRRCEATCS